jgi:hypothetical protein
MKIATGTHVVIGAFVDERVANHQGAEILLNLLNK